MITDGKFYSQKKEEYHYSQQLQNCIFQVLEYCLTPLIVDQAKKSINKPIMMLGKIQSGKTRAYTGLMALAFDNSFDLVIILTKNSTALIKQTYRRMRNEFHIAINDNEIDVVDIMKKLDSRLTNYELKKKLIFIAKKQRQNLDRIISFINEYALQNKKNFLIIDDEADTTSIGYSKNKENDDEFDLRIVASKINSLRGNLNGCALVQVTATPYALYLQPEIELSSIEPIKPELTVLVPSGEGYIGGEYYFIQSQQNSGPAQFIYEEVSNNELEIVTLQKGDRRVFKEEEILTQDKKLIIFKKGLVNFIIGGIILRAYEPKRHFAYVIHTNTQKSSHIRLERITQYFIEEIKKRTKAKKEIIDNLIDISYFDLKRAYGIACKEILDCESIRNQFYQEIDDDNISITVINSDKDIDPILNEDNGELKLRTPFSIFVGGQVLDRGVTIPNMIGFYYGRNPKRMQQDTVLQHSRMFGYRRVGDLFVTRFYTTRLIYENMTKITELDSALRDDIEKRSMNDGIFFIKEDEKGRIVPCSPEKIKASNIILISPGRRLLPIGFSIIGKTYASQTSKHIEQCVYKLIDPSNRSGELLPIHKLDQIINLAYEAINPDETFSSRFITREYMLATLRLLTKKDPNAFLIVRRNRKISKYKENGSSYSDAPDTPHDELIIARKLAVNNPVLMMLHQDGSAEGWEGSEFWWPVLLVQKNFAKTIFALDQPSGKIN